jgi:ABC-type cobalamin/Fe3+-siderophores transport system ATPase subunit
LNNQFPRQPDGSPDWETFVSRLELLDVAVVGITDYFTIDGYKKVKGFKDAGRMENIQTVLPNIEFRLNNVLSSRKDGDKPRRLNFHVIFSDEVATQDIEEHFLHDLDFYYEGSPQNRDQTRKLKVSNIEALGKKLIQENQQLRGGGETPLVIGARTTVISHEQVTEILTRDSRFKDKYLLIFPEELLNLIEWGKQDHVIRQGLLQKSDMVFSSNSRTKMWCVGLDPYKEGPDAFIKEFKSLKPCIHGSDAHNLDYMGRPCAKRGIPSHDCVAHPGDCELRHSWIKADPTFEGLKQLKYEPVDRVRIQQSDPTPLKSNSCISGLRMDGTTVNEELSLALTNLPFNAGLVAVTGGKGAGKTALVDLIANLFVDRCNSSDPNSFVRRIVRDNANLNVAITLGDGTLFEKSLTDSRFVEQSEVVYIAQGELEDYIGENSDLNKYIRDLIFESVEVKNTVKAFEFDKLAKRVREVEIEINQRNQAIERLEGRTAEKVLADAKREKAQIEAESRDVESKIPALESRLTKEKIEVVEEKQTSRSKLQDRKRDLIELGELLANAIQFVSEDLSRFNLYASKINALLKELKIEGAIPTLEYAAVKGLGVIAEKVESELGQVVAAIEASEKELHGYEAEMQEHARYLSRRNDLAARLAGVTKKLEIIASDAQELDKNRIDRDSLFGELLRTILQLQQKYAEIIEVFGSQKAEVLSDLDFKPNVQFARATLLDGLQEILDNRQVDVIGTEGSLSQFQTLQELYGQVASGSAAAIDPLVSETSRLCVEMKGKMKKAQAISVGNLYKCLYRTYLNVVPIVTYKKTALNKLLLGQKATVLIKIYLAQGRNPIIIDSHDDHLDNEFIMDELVGAIRKAKTYRQVILASNNGNVVINSDSEQIVLAHRQQGQISYLSGSIENPAIRDRALKVLEGGADAFKKRQEKYRVES